MFIAGFHIYAQQAPHVYHQASELRQITVSSPYNAGITRGQCRRTMRQPRYTLQMPPNVQPAAYFTSTYKVCVTNSYFQQAGVGGL